MIPLLNESFQDFVLEHNDLHVNILNKTITETPIADLFTRFYTEDAERVYVNEGYDMKYQIFRLEFSI